MKRARATWLFFAIAFGGAWAGWIAQAVLHVTQPHALAWALTYASGDCCALAGFIAVYSAQGWPGVRHLLRRCTRWRVPVRWWVYVLGLPTVWGALAAAGYGVKTGHLMPVYPLKLALLFTPTYLFWFVTGPLGEEAGWRGFLLPRLLERFTPLQASLAIGVIHALWHLPLYYDSSFASVPNTAHFLISVVCYNTLYTVVFLNTRFSVLMTILMHWSINLTPYAIGRVFPSVPDNPVSSWMEVAALVMVTVIVVRLAAPQLLARPQGERDLLMTP